MIRLLGAGGLLIVLLAPRASAAPVDVLMITLDTTRGDALGAYGGGSHTPHMDHLANSGIYFREATTPMPRTTPAIASLFSGRYPYRHGSREVGQPVDAVPMLAERLKEAGYYTIAVSANASAGPAHGLDRGFDVFVRREDIEQIYGSRLFVDHTKAGTGPQVGLAQAVREQSAKALEKAPPGKPVFVWQLYFDPHLYYEPPPAEPQPEAPTCREVYRFIKEDTWRRAGLISSGRHPLAARSLNDCRALYAAEVAYVDRQIGVFLDLWRARMEESQITILNADHGENFGEHGLRYEHGDNVHHGALRVPLVFQGEGIPKGVSARNVSLIDVAPTLLSLLDIGPLPETDGIDLSDWCLDAPCPGDDGYRFAESANAVTNFNFHRLMTGWSLGVSCVNQSPFTLCLDKQRDTALYNHVADPELRENVAENHPAIVARLKQIYAHWPIDSARQLTVFDQRYKVTWYPRADGAYQEELYDRLADPAEEDDIGSDQALRLQAMSALLDRIEADMPGAEPANPNPKIVEQLRGLGYVQ